MKKVLLATLLVLACMATAVAQNQDSVYHLGYYQNRNNAAGADQTVELINTGVVGVPTDANEGRLCANIYVFDANQEMEECCSCKITANGLKTLSVLNDLTQNPLTGFPAPDAGAIKIVTSIPAGSTCDETAVATATLSAGILGWGSHVKQPVAGTFITTEADLQLGTLSAREIAFLGQACGFVQYLGSGKGVCKCGIGG